MAYTKQVWVDGTTPLDAEHMNHIEDGIEANAAGIEELKAASAVTAFTQSGSIVKCEPKAGSTLTVKTDADVIVYSTGKNLIGKASLNTGVMTRNGVTFTFEDDGSVTLNGTVTDEFYPVLFANGDKSIHVNVANYGIANRLVLPANSPYRLSAVVSGSVMGATAEYQKYPGIGVYLADETYYNYNVYNKQQFESGEIIGVNHITIACLSGFTFDNYNIKWQLEVGSVTTEYEPHAGILETSSSGEVTLNALDGVNTVWASSGDVSVSGVKKGYASALQGVDVTAYDLPVLYLTGDTSAMTKENAVDLDYIYGDLSGTASVKWQGTSSLNYPKKNYTVKFDTAFEAKEGWGEQKKYCFKANFIDYSHARNIVCARLWGQICASRSAINETLAASPNYGAVDGFPCIIMLNGEFLGMYTWNIPKDGWMANMGSGTAEAILCAENVYPGSALAGAATVGEAFELEYVTDEDNADWVQTALDNLINAILASDGTDLDTTIAQYIDWDSAIDLLVFNLMFGGYDLLLKNYLLSTYDGTQWIMGAYDMDSTFGNWWNGQKILAVNDSSVTPEYIVANNKINQLIRNYKLDEFKARYKGLRAGVLSEINVGKAFDDFAATIPATILHEDAKLWTTIPNTLGNNVHQIKDWYRLRCQYVDDEINSWS